MTRRFRTYAARGAGRGGPLAFDDCTLAPTAAVASIPFAPELAIPAVLEMYKRFGKHIYAKYGFLDAFNLNFTFSDHLRQGRCDQGAILAMIENYRSGLVWRTMRRSPYVRDGLQRAGFTGGWLSGPSS